MNFRNGACRLLVLLVISGTIQGCAACESQGTHSIGLIDGKLGPCPDSPNCVCSEYENRVSHVGPLSFTGDFHSAWKNARGAVLDIGGNIEKETDVYLRATFTSRLFRFVDDLELRMDKASHNIHVRTASRFGYSDLGVNRKRVQNLRKSFNGKNN